MLQEQHGGPHSSRMKAFGSATPFHRVLLALPLPSTGASTGQVPPFSSRGQINSTHQVPAAHSWSCHVTGAGIGWNRLPFFNCNPGESNITQFAKVAAPGSSYFALLPRTGAPPLSLPCHFLLHHTMHLS
jgi:hypothetical protein